MPLAREGSAPVASLCVGIYYCVFLANHLHLHVLVNLIAKGSFSKSPLDFTL